MNTRVEHCSGHLIGLRKLVAMVASALLLAGAAHADKHLLFSAPHTPSADCTAMWGNNITDAKKSSTNQYVLLLMFTLDGVAKAHTFFHTVAGTDKADPQAGCIGDPDSVDKLGRAAAALFVQGSCPTDCVKPPLRLEGKGEIGDPLTYIDSHPVWGLFFGDSGGAYQTSQGDDKDTKIRVWQITVSNSCHAGRILKQVTNSNGFPKDVFLGHVLVGYKELAAGTATAKSCMP